MSRDGAVRNAYGLIEIGPLPQTSAQFLLASSGSEDVVPSADLTDLGVKIGEGQIVVWQRYRLVWDTSELSKSWKPSCSPLIERFQALNPSKNEEVKRCRATGDDAGK